MKKMFRPMAIIVIFIVLVACSTNSEDTKKDNESNFGISKLISELEAKGYYKYIDKSQVENVKKASIEAGYIYGWEDSGRDFSTDAESLAEGGVSHFLESISEFLQKQNVKVIVSDEMYSDKGYNVTVNGKFYEIYNEKEIESENIWELSTNRCFSIINNLLENSGSSERIYILYGGNDLRAIFLTDEMYKLIIDDNNVPESELPQIAPDVF